MKYVQLIEYNLRNYFLEKSYKKCGGETIPRPFFKKSKLSISLDQYSKVSYILCLLFANLRTIENILKLSADHLHLRQIKLFQKTKRVLELVSLLDFLHDFRRKIFLLLYSFTNQISMFGCLYLVRYWAICVL